MFVTLICGWASDVGVALSTRRKGSSQVVQIGREHEVASQIKRMLMTRVMVCDIRRPFFFKNFFMVLSFPPHSKGLFGFCDLQAQILQIFYLFRKLVPVNP
jgi:hypothetical protein